MAKEHQNVKVFSSTGPEKIFERSLTMPKKLKWGTLWYFSTSILSQNSSKKLRDPLGFSNIQSVAKLQKMNRGPFGENCFSEKRSRNGEKKLKGDPLASSGIVCYAVNFLVQFPGPTGAIQNFVELLVELFWSLQVYRKK